ARSVQIRSTNDSETSEQNARTPHPALPLRFAQGQGHPLPASRGEGHSTLPPRVSFSPLAGRRCREAAEGARAARIWTALATGNRQRLIASADHRNVDA